MPHTFPADLVQAQRDWYATYRQLAGTSTAAGSGGTQATVLRRRLVRLSVQVTAHPYWTTIPGTAPAARMELKQLAWAEEPRPDRDRTGREPANRPWTDGGGRAAAGG
jgi:hypothetical protein